MPDACVIALPDPSSRLVAAHRDIHARRMLGLPFVNASLEVEAVGFAPWNGAWLGVMLTPWFMNLMLLPGDAARWIRVPVGGKHTYRFPAGDYEFIGGEHVLLGEYQSCSLFSPVLEFEDQVTARLVAALAREALFDAGNADTPAYPAPTLSARDPSPAPLGCLEAELDAPLSKRDFLRGRFLHGEHVDRR